MRDSHGNIVHVHVPYLFSCPKVDHSSGAVRVHARRASSTGVHEGRTNVFTCHFHHSMQKVIRTVHEGRWPLNVFIRAEYIGTVVRKESTTTVPQSLQNGEQARCELSQEKKEACCMTTTTLTSDNQMMLENVSLEDWISREVSANLF